MRQMRLGFLVLAFILLSGFFRPLLLVNISSATPQDVVQSYEDIIRNGIDFEKIKSHVEFFSGVDSRVTGYPGYEKAAQYVYEKFVEYGLTNVSYHLYNVAIPIDYGSNITILSEDKVIQAYAVWPNQIQTSAVLPPGITSSLVYLGDGSLSSFDGKKVRDSIALMDLNSGDRWLKAAQLGAKAVIFLGLPSGNPAIFHEEVERLYLISAPIYFPRLYVKYEDGQYLLRLLSSDKDAKVRLLSNVQWEKKVGKNIIGLIPGKEIPQETVVLSAHYDSSAVIPGLSPGANEATGIATLLELVKFFVRNPPRRTVMVIAFSGHGQNMLGARYLILDAIVNGTFPRLWRIKYAHLSDLIKYVEKGQNRDVKLVADIDLTTEGDGASTVPMGWGYRAEGYLYWSEVVDRFRNIIYGKTGFSDKVREVWMRVYGRTWSIPDQGTLTASEWRGYTPNVFYSTGEVFQSAGFPTLLFRTSNAWYRYWETPYDTIDNVQFDNLRPQVEFTFTLLFSLSNLSSDEYGRVSTQWYNLSIFGQAVEYDPKAGWYKPIPNAIVHMFTASGRWHLAGRGSVTVIADENGRFVIPWIEGTPTISVYVTNSSGSILYAPDYGKYGDKVFPNTVMMARALKIDVGYPDQPRQFVAFKAGSMALFDLWAIIPKSELTQREWHTDWSSGVEEWPQVQIGVDVLDTDTHVTADHWGFSRDGSAMVLFLPPGEPVKAIMTAITPGERGIPVITLLNATRENPEGLGFKLRAGQYVSLQFSPKWYLQDMTTLSGSRMEMLQKYLVYTGADEYLQYAETVPIDEDISENQFLQGFSSALQAWSSARIAYVLITENMKDSINTAVVYFLVLILFVFLFERIVFGFHGLKRLLSFAVLFVLFLAPVSVFHPAFSLASSILVVFLGLTCLILVVPIAAILLMYATSSAKKFRIKQIGRHAIEVSRLNLVMSAMSTGTGHMKKRKFRTALTVITLAILSFSLITFSSVTPRRTVKEFAVEGEPKYLGALVRNPKDEPMSPSVVDILRMELDGVGDVMPRYVLYPTHLEFGYNLSGSTGHWRIKALYGISSAEGERLWEVFGQTDGRWFNDLDYQSIILSDSVAARIGAKIGDTVRLGTIDLKVVNVLDESQVSNLRDIDQWPPYPKDLRAGERKTKLNVYDVAILPLKLVEDLGGRIFSVILLPSENVDFSLFQGKTYWIAKLTTAEIFLSDGVGPGNSVKNISAVYNIGLGGYEINIFMMILVVLVVANTIFGIISERTNEISTLSTLGLAPLHVASMFLAESAAYAAIGSVLGYVMGITTSRLAYQTGLMPVGFYPNYSSKIVLVDIILVLVSTVSSSIFPLIKVAKLVTPSLERKWKFETHPHKDFWEVSTPFVFSDAKDAVGILNYIKEYFKDHTAELTESPFIVKDLSIRKGEDEMTLISSVHIPPFSAGIHQKVEVKLMADESRERWNTKIFINRVYGNVNLWKKSNESFVDRLRKQLLLWRDLTPSERNHYRELRLEET